MSIWDVPAKVWTLARKMEDLLALQGQTKTALEAIETRLHSVEDRMMRLEVSRGELITEAKAAAGVAAAGVAGSVISEVVTRLTRIEMQIGSLGSGPSAPKRLGDQQ